MQARERSFSKRIQRWSKIGRKEKISEIERYSSKRFTEIVKKEISVQKNPVVIRNKTRGTLSRRSSNYPREQEVLFHDDPAMVQDRKKREDLRN